MTDGAGLARTTIAVPRGPFSSFPPQIRITATAKAEGAIRGTLADLPIALPALSVYLAHSTIHAGTFQTITALAQQGTPITIGIHAPRRQWQYAGTTDVLGSVSRDVRIQARDVTPTNRTVQVVVQTRTDKAITVRKAFRVLDP
jgi:hypothetical protein